MTIDGDFKADFAAVASAALARAETLVPEWLKGGRREGPEWKCGDLTGAPGRSLSVNLRTGVWKDFNDEGVGGPDLVALYAQIHGLKPWEACKELARVLGVALRAGRPGSQESSRAEPPATVPQTSAPPPEDRNESAKWLPLHPVPADAPDFKTQWGHYARGVPGRHWVYRDEAGLLLGVVCRFETSDGGKDVQPLSYCQHVSGRRHWRYKAFAEPRPLYGLDQIASGAELAIMVEGEKCRDALFAALGCSTPVLAWPGGGKAVRKVDWSPLKRFKRLVCWPDADAQVDKRTQRLKTLEEQSGIMAMRHVAREAQALGLEVRLVDVGQPGERPSGWDCADAIEEGWDRDRLLAFMRHFLPDVQASADSSGANVVRADFGGGKNAPPRRSAPAGGGNEPPDEEWRARLIWRNPWSLRECTPNVIEIMCHHPAWRGVLGFDEFAQRVVKRQAAPFDPPGRKYPAEWADVDDTRATVWLAQHEHFVPSAGNVAEAVEVVARTNLFHPVLNYLRTLRHDGIVRTDTWLTDFLGVPDSPYVRKVGRYYLTGMCMRVLQPGVKFDYCLVLEGKQGRQKSSALEVLAGEWFSDTDLDLSHKDSMSYIRGKWLHEFAEMGSLMRAEEKRQKSFLSRKVDEFRPTYGRREIRCPRQLVFAGSTNEFQWNKDPTGGRRFWPVSVPGDIDLVGLRAMRDQLLAEAFALALAGERYWPTSEEQRALFDEEQLSREIPEAFVSILHNWMQDPLSPEEFSLATAIMSGLRVEVKSISRDIQTRAGIALAKLGCERIERRNDPDRSWYKRVRRNPASSGSQTSAPFEPPTGAEWRDPFA